MINTNNLKHSHPKIIDVTPLATIIIPAKNEELFIVNTLKALQLLNYEKEKIEIIVANNNSTDSTKVKAKNFGAIIIDVTTDNVGKLRNIAAQSAKGKILAFLDADCVPNQDWLKNACILLMKEDCVTGSKVCCPTNATWIERAWFSEGYNGRRQVNYINSGNLLIRKETFFRIGGFDDSLITGEDAEFCARAIKQVKIIEDGAIRVVHLGNPKNLRSFFRREIWHGLGAFGTFRQNWFDKPLLATILFSISCMGLIYSLILPQSVSRISFLLCIFIPASIVLLSAGIKSVKRKRIVYFFPLVILYFIYFTSRSIALVLLTFRIKSYKRVR